MQYDLEERTLKFAKDIIELASKIPRNPVTFSMVSQLVRAGTSVGANYREANGASSRKDFRHKITICKKEVKETGYWLDLLKDIEVKLATDIKKLFTESVELGKIFTKILQTIDSKDSH